MSSNVTEDVGAVTSDDATWILTAAFVIFTMQTGFGLLESGAVSKKNEVNILSKNAVDVILGGLSYWVFGYGLQYGKEPGTTIFCGVGYFLLDSSPDEMGIIFATFIFQLSFATTATTIVSGAMAERANFNAYCIFSFVNTVVYCIPAGWIWGDHGYLKHLGALDFAGSSAVHLVGGASALVACLLLKPRLRKIEAMGASLPMGNSGNAVVGTFTLWWGWLMFNCGSTFGISNNKWHYAGRAAINTMNASLGGGIAAIFYTYWKNKQYNVSDILNGILAALVGVTAGSAFLGSASSVLVGAVGAILSCYTTPMFEKFDIDDPVSAIAVHGVGGIWGMAAVGLFIEDDPILELSNGRKGLFQGGGFYLLGVQLLTCLCVIIWSMSFSLLESGCVTRKNEVNIMMKNVVDVLFGGIAYWMFGYGLSFGEERGANPLFGVGFYFVEASQFQMGYVFAEFLFQLSFATTATTICSGAMAERCNLTSYCIFSFFNIVIFCLPAHWIWSRLGFLSQMKVVDIAGCSAVHLVGGISGLVATLMLKPRLGRYEVEDETVAMNCPTNAIVGMFMLCYAFKKRKFIIINIINGILSSLVSITAGCAIYHPFEALIIGAISSLMTNISMPLLDRFRIDDPVGAISVHVIGSIWGMISIGLFVEEDLLLKLSQGQSGLFRGGGFRLLGVQVLAVVIIGIWSAVTTFLLLFVINKFVPIRMSKEEELAGSDFVEHGITFELEDTQSVIGSLVNLLEPSENPSKFLTAKMFFQDSKFKKQKNKIKNGFRAIRLFRKN
ncbi:putative ammonium transporter 3 [Centruroides sculpturatus]|uniref:putative ammonium transporter 3 n=1 Tax=Centruroides sculpturatus TaxID=218467 RepID=UPI000C6D2418|nr:putative ammonium transporter 3 [Centruroides sculpturatus]